MTPLQNKRGDLTGILYLIIGIACMGIFLLVVGFIGSEVTTRVKEQINSTNDEINNAFDSGVNVSKNSLTTVWLIVFVGLLIGLMVTSYMMPTNPIFVPVFIIMLITSVIVGVALSNTYEQIYNEATFNSISTTQTLVYFVMSNLPYLAFIVGIIGIIVTFAKPGGSSTLM